MKPHPLPDAETRWLRMRGALLVMSVRAHDGHHPTPADDGFGTLRDGPPDHAIDAIELRRGDDGSEGGLRAPGRPGAHLLRQGDELVEELVLRLALHDQP